MSTEPPVTSSTAQALRDWIAEIERVLDARDYRWWSPRDQLLRAHLQQELAEKRRILARLAGPTPQSADGGNRLPTAHSGPTTRLTA